MELENGATERGLPLLLRGDSLGLKDFCLGWNVLPILRDSQNDDLLQQNGPRLYLQTILLQR